MQPRLLIPCTRICTRTHACNRLLARTHVHAPHNCHSNRTRDTPDDLPSFTRTLPPPQDFPKTFLIAGPYQVFMYALVGITGYYYKGDAVTGFIIDNIPTGAAYVTSAVFLSCTCWSRT